MLTVISPIFPVQISEFPPAATTYWLRELILPSRQCCDSFENSISRVLDTNTWAIHHWHLVEETRVAEQTCVSSLWFLGDWVSYLKTHLRSILGTLLQFQVVAIGDRVQCTQQAARVNMNVKRSSIYLYVHKSPIKQQIYCFGGKREGSFRLQKVEYSGICTHYLNNSLKIVHYGKRPL